MEKIRKKIGKILSGVGITLIIFVGIIYTQKEQLSVWNTVLSIAISYAIQFSWTAFLDCTDNTVWKEQLRTYRRKNIIKKDERIRISFAYLFRIQVDGKYLLVQNGRGTGKYQPVGGAYKVKEEEKLYLKEKLYVTDDDKMPLDRSSKNDYRMFVPENNLKKFVRRFDKTLNREYITNLSREFTEELIKTRILDKDFGKVTYRYCGRHYTGIEFSRYFQCHELLLADIVEVQLTTEQEEKLRALMEKNDRRYRFAGKKEIEHCGIAEDKEKYTEDIADHTIKILGEKEQYLRRIKRDRGKYSFDI